MASDPVLDLDALLAPIPGDSRVGPNVRYLRPSPHDAIRALLPKKATDLLSDEGGQAGQWTKLADLASELLREQTKDLFIASWLTEAVVHLHGFAGLRDGLKLIHGLCDQYWDDVHPQADPQDTPPLDARATLLQTLLARNACLWIKEIPLTSSSIRHPETDEEFACNYNLYDSIVITKLTDRKPLQDRMEKATRDSPNDFVLGIRDDLEEVAAAARSLNELLDQRLEKIAPSTVNLRNALDDCRNLVAKELKRRGLTTDTQPAEAIAASNGDKPQNPRANGAPSGPIQCREDALAHLREAADFFRRTEPHSPVPFLIERAINWSRMPFDKLILELVKDENSRSAINSTLGIALGESSSENNGETPSE